jgi:hypothetical protein
MKSLSYWADGVVMFLVYALAQEQKRCNKSQWMEAAEITSGSSPTSCKYPPKPKPYITANMPTTTANAYPHHRSGVTNSGSRASQSVVLRHAQKRIQVVHDHILMDFPHTQQEDADNVQVQGGDSVLAN